MLRGKKIKYSYKLTYEFYIFFPFYGNTTNTMVRRLYFLRLYNGSMNVYRVFNRVSKVHDLCTALNFKKHVI